jgi:hypothetical protein
MGFQGAIPGFQAGQMFPGGAVYPGAPGFVDNPFPGMFMPQGFQPFAGGYPAQKFGFNAGSGFDGTSRGNVNQRKRNGPVEAGHGHGRGRGNPPVQAAVEAAGTPAMGLAQAVLPVGAQPQGGAAAVQGGLEPVGQQVQALPQMVAALNNAVMDGEVLKKGKNPEK